MFDLEAVIWTDHVLVLSQYTSITLPFQIGLNGGWSSMSLHTEKGLLLGHFTLARLSSENPELSLSRA